MPELFWGVLHSFRELSVRDSLGMWVFRMLFPVLYQVWELTVFEPLGRRRRIFPLRACHQTSVLSVDYCVYRECRDVRGT